jgi:putative tricarboxylic transport membrane protein
LFKALFTLCAAAALMNASAHAQSTWKPERNIEILVGSSSGTGTDRTARLMQKIWQEQKIVDMPAAVVNKPGGGSAVAMAYLNTHAGEGNYMLVTSYNIVTNEITGRSTMAPKDFTMIALLISEYIGYAVRPDSPYKTLADLAKALRENPETVTVGTSSAAGGANHIAMGLLAKAAGADLKKLKVVIYNGGGEALAAMLGGHVQVWVNSASSLSAQMNSNTIRTLAIAAPKRMPGSLAKTPTMKEAGMPVVADNWRLVIAPKGLSAAQTGYWDGVFKRFTQSAEWNKDLDSANMSNNYMNSAETTRYINSEYGDIKTILTELGLAKAPK